MDWGELRANSRGNAPNPLNQCNLSFEFLIDGEGINHSRLQDLLRKSKINQLQSGMLFHFQLVGMAMFQGIGFIAEGSI